mmetsp:Transcript_24840/g.72766  ORF Transcript_24840/g.72766 Transcript_24840/m.72766 type:complete len:238 (+) Transcript_24840:585-1298(+)
MRTRRGASVHGRDQIRISDPGRPRRRFRVESRGNRRSAGFEGVGIGRRAEASEQVRRGVAVRRQRGEDQSRSESVEVPNIRRHGESLAEPLGRIHRRRSEELGRVGRLQRRARSLHGDGEKISPRRQIGNDHGGYRFGRLLLLRTGRGRSGEDPEFGGDAGEARDQDRRAAKDGEDHGGAGGRTERDVRLRRHHGKRCASRPRVRPGTAGPSELGQLLLRQLGRSDAPGGERPGAVF